MTSDDRSRSAIATPLHILGAQLDKCSPEMRDLIRLALAGANGEAHEVEARTQEMARLRLNEAVLQWTQDARKAAA